MRQGRRWAVVALMVAAIATVAHAEDWQALGERNFDYRSPQGTVVTSAAEVVSHVRLQVKQNALEIGEVTLYFDDGASQIAKLDAYVPAGRQTPVIDVEGGPKRVAKVDFTYRSGDPDKHIALVRVLGSK
jgi:hypothetical protein